MLKSYILFLVSLALIHPISVSAAPLQQDYTTLSIRNSGAYSSDYTTMQSYYTQQSLPKIQAIQAAEAEQRKIAEEKARQEEADAEQARLAELTRARAVVVAKPIILQSFDSFDYESFIRERCDQLGCNADQLIRVMYCESGGRSNAVNRGGSGASGLFQFIPSTFSANARRLGMSGANIWNPRDQIIIATYMFANGQAGQWSCK